MQSILTWMLSQHTFFKQSKNVTYLLFLLQSMNYFKSNVLTCVFPVGINVLSQNIGVFTSGSD